MATNRAFIYVGQLIHSTSATELKFIKNGVVVVVDTAIAALEENTYNLEVLSTQFKVSPEQVYRLTSKQFLIPGFIDSHIHGTQYPNVGLGADLPLLDWLDKYTFPLETRFSDAQFADKVYQAVVKQTLSSGTTTACYFATIHNETALLLADAARTRNQRAFVGKVNMNVNAPDHYVESLEDTLKNTEIFLKAMPLKGLVRPIITPRFAITCDMEAMQGLAKLAEKYDVNIQTHVSENKDEVAAVAEMYPDCPNYCSVYDKAGLLKPKTILAHGVHLTNDELELLRARGAAIAHCANSNITLQSGLCHVRRLINANIKVGLGTDCAGGTSTSMQDAIRQTLQTSITVAFSEPSMTRLSISEAFFLATLGGAQALAIDNITGNLLVGKEFDALIVDMAINPAIDILEELTLEQLFQKFIYLGDDRNIFKVYVGGQLSLTK